MVSRQLVLGILVSILGLVTCKEEIFEQEIGGSFKINPSTESVKKLHLKCGADSMQIQLDMAGDFDGVMYTRGSFYKQKEPCFVKKKTRGEKTLSMKFPFDKCQTEQNGDIFSNTVIVQHDLDLITPGDSAFKVECDFRKARSITVGAEMSARDSDQKASGSRISVISPDPSESDDLITGGESAFSESSSVEFIPKSSPIHVKDEL